MLQRRDTVDHLGPLLQKCKSEMLRAEVQRRREFKHLYQQDSQVTVGTTLSKLALEARMQKQHSYSFVYKQQPSPISIPSSLFPGCKVESDHDIELSEIPLKVLTTSGNLIKLDVVSENVSIHSCGSAELKDKWLQALEFPPTSPISYEEVIQERKLDDSDLKSVKSTISSKEHVPADYGGVCSIETLVENKLSLKDEDTTPKKSITRSVSSVKSEQGEQTVELKFSKTSSEKRTSSQKSVSSAASKDVATKPQSLSSQAKSEQKESSISIKSATNQATVEESAEKKSSVSVKSATNQAIVEHSAEKKASQLTENETKLVSVSSKTSDTTEKKTSSSKSNSSNNKKERSDKNVKETESDKLKSGMGLDTEKSAAEGQAAGNEASNI